MKKYDIAVKEKQLELLKEGLGLLAEHKSADGSDPKECAVLLMQINDQALIQDQHSKKCAAEGSEKKERTCELLAKFLKETDYGEDIESIAYKYHESNEEYPEPEELVTLNYKCGCKLTVQVTGDTSLQMVRDILRHFFAE